MLAEAEELSQRYAQEIAKAPPPSRSPLTQKCLQTASIWFSLDWGTPHLASEDLWQMMREIGVEGVRLTCAKPSGSLLFSPEKQREWEKVARTIEKRGLSLIGEIVGNATAPSTDFKQALQNAGDYPDLYHLIEIDPQDWKLLPSAPAPDGISNVPWLTLQELHKKGYVPEHFAPYIKESDWNVTAKICGADGKVRRWIYLKQGIADPILSWLSPSFAAFRLAAGDVLHAAFDLGQTILQIDGNLPLNAQEMLTLWIRKIGAFSASATEGGIAELKESPTDLADDILTRPALLHALIAEDAEALRLIYRLFLEEGIEAKRLVHALQPFDRFACDWAEWLRNPKKQYRYWEEKVTGEVLRRRLLKEDLLRLGSSEGETLPPSTWVGYCSIKAKKKEEILQAHLLLAFAYAMQPGVFSFSLADLLGALPHCQIKKLDLLDSNGTSALYSSLPQQLKTSNSFASQLKMILAARRASEIATAELIAVPPVAHPGTLLLAYSLPGSGSPYLLALNFSCEAVTESIEWPKLRNTSAIDLMTSLAEEKIFTSGTLSFTLPPLTGKAFFFQSKYYEPVAKLQFRPKFVQESKFCNWLL